MRSKNTYAEKLLDPRWQQLRLRVFARDEWSCRTCHKTTETLHAHHVHYHPLAEGPWDYDIDSIITLCANCHSDEHSDLEASCNSCSQPSTTSKVAPTIRARLEGRITLSATFR